MNNFTTLSFCLKIRPEDKKTEIFRKCYWILQEKVISKTKRKRGHLLFKHDFSRLSQYVNNNFAVNFRMIYNISTIGNGPGTETLKRQYKNCP